MRAANSSTQPLLPRPNLISIKQNTMKQTSNAIKFLLAQYRAIFKSAYFKGLATAAVVTAGLAASQAQAATNIDQSVWGNLTQNSDGVTIANGDTGSDGSNGLYQNFSFITGASTDAEQNIVITSGSSHSISGATNGSVTVSGSATAITLSGSTATDPSFAITAGNTGSGATLGISSFTVTKGTLNLTGKDATTLASLKAKTITLNGASADEAIINIAAAGFGELDGRLVTTASGGTINFSGSGTLKTYTDQAGIAVDINVASQKSAVLDLSGYDTTEQKLFKLASGTVSLSGDGSASGGIFQVKDGTLEIDDAVILTTNATTSGGGISLNGSSTDSAVLKLSSTQLKSLVTADDPDGNSSNDGKGYVDFTSSGTIALTDKGVDLSTAGITFGTTAGTAGSVNAASSANAVISGSGLKISSTLSGAGNITVKSDILSITENETNGTGVKATIAQNYNLTLATANDSTEGYTVTGYDHGYAVTETIDNPFYETNNPDFNDTDKQVNVAGTDSIGEDLIVGDGTNGSTLSILAGHYTDSNDINLNKGSLTVGGQATGSEYEGIDASLTLQSGSTLKLDNTSGANTITVKGNAGNVSFGKNNYQRPAEAVLNISAADLKIVGHASNYSKITVGAHGTLVVNADQALDIINLANDEELHRTNSGASVLLSGGTLQVNGDFAAAGGTKGVSVTKLVSGDAIAATDKIYFHSTGGVLEANSIHLSAEDGESLNIGSGGTLRADSITLDQAVVNGERQNFNVASGVLEVGSSLGGQAKSITFGTGTSSADLTLGSITQDTDATYGIRADITTYTTSADNGNVNVDLVLNGKEAYAATPIKDTSKLDVNFGTWQIQDLTATNATITVGDDEFDGNNSTKPIYNAALIGDALTLNSGVQMTVHTNATTTFNTLNLAGGNVTVDNTTMTINGVHTPAVEADPDNNVAAVAESWGLTTSAGTITVKGRKGILHIGADALEGLSTTKATGKTVYTYTNDNVAQAAGFVSLSDYAVLELELTDSVTFDATALQELRKDFIFDSDGSVIEDGFIDIGDAKIDGLDTKNGTVDWQVLKGYSDILADVLQNDLQDATLVNVNPDEIVQANVGSIVVKGSAQSVDLSDTNLYNAAGNTTNAGSFFSNANGDLIDANIQSGAHVSLNNGGNAGTITLQPSSELSETTLTVVSETPAEGEAPVTNIERITGGSNTVFEIDGQTAVSNGVYIGTMRVNDKITVTGDTTIREGLESSENASGDLIATGELNVGKLTVNGGANYAGDINATDVAVFGNNDPANIDFDYYLAGNNTFTTVTFHDEVEFDVGTTNAERMILGDNLSVYGNGSVNTNVLEFIANTTGRYIAVGESAGEDAVTGETWDSSTGYLTVGRLDLAGNSLIADPTYDKAATVVAVGSFGTSTSIDSLKGNDAGVINGSVVALQNSIIGVGVTDSTEENGASAIAQLQELFASYIDSTDGSLSDAEDGIGSIVYIDDSVDVAVDTSKLVLDASRNGESYLDIMRSSTGLSTADSAFKTAVTNNEVYLGANTALAFGNSALTATSSDGTTTTARGAIHFTGGDASIYGAGGKIILTGGQFNTIDDVVLFTDEGANNGVTIAADGQKILVESLSGIYYMELNPGDETTGGQLNLNHDRLHQVFTSASQPVKNTLVAYAERNNNWANGTAAVDRLVGARTEGITYNATNRTFTDAEGNVLDSNKYVAISVTDKNTGTISYEVYEEAYNPILDHTVMYSSSGADAETVARLGVYGGVAQSAMAAGASTYEAISGRMGVGANGYNITIADNTQGAALWLTPIYKSSDADGFDADGVSYGGDLDLYGVALGADYTLANNLRLGVMFNVGSGEIDGSGSASNVSNDFDYYGFGAYVGYTYGALSIVGDVTYTIADNDIDGHTSVQGYETVSTSLDSANFSVGVSGQYAFDINGLSLVPHIGLRYSDIDIDDYSISDVASYESDSLSIFSIPVGVTIAKEFTSDSWTIKPSVDFTVAGNFGDDSADGTVRWVGISNHATDVSSEVIDNFTYGATVGVAAQTGAFSMGLGINYTGSDNIDSFGVTANARFVF